MFVYIGKKFLKEGFNLIGSYIDFLWFDLKLKLLYELNEFVFLKIYYYGGIKKYYWVNVFFSIYGVVVKSDGFKIKIVIGEDESDFVFYIIDFFVYLFVEQF